MGFTIPCEHLIRVLWEGMDAGVTVCQFLDHYLVDTSPRRKPGRRSVAPNHSCGVMNRVTTFEYANVAYGLMVYVIR